MAQELKVGEVWKVTGRKGPLTLRLLHDIADPSVDGWFDAEIVDGTVRFMSVAYREAQAEDGLGTTGTTMTFRTTLTNFVQRISPEA